MSFERALAHRFGNPSRPIVRSGRVSKVGTTTVGGSTVVEVVVGGRPMLTGVAGLVVGDLVFYVDQRYPIVVGKIQTP